MMQFRASSVGKLMAYPDKNVLPDGALSYIYEMASQILLGWKPELDVNAVNKGIQCENESIALYNLVKNKCYIKNNQRITTDLLTGEWDIYDQLSNTIIDIKSAYSKKTFPLLIKEGDKKLYEWQLDVYMLLKNADYAGIVYTLVDTPDELIGRFEPQDWHHVSDIPPKLRITEFFKERDEKREKQIIDRVKLAQQRLYDILEDKGYDWGVINNFSIENTLEAA